jgi:hypothetical protein
MENQRHCDTDHVLAEMRLLIEGAVNLYEGDAMPLSRLAIDYGTLSAANAFTNSNTWKIVVPDNLYDQWIAATNWSTFASRIVKASEFVEPTNEE